jgi:hypothetical protein
MKTIMVLVVAGLLSACGTAYSLRDAADDRGVSVAYDTSVRGLIEQKIQYLLEVGDYQMVSRETFSGKTTVYLEHGSELNLTAGQRGLKTGRLYRLVFSAGDDAGVLYVLGQEKFGFNSAETMAAARTLAKRLTTP